MIVKSDFLFSRFEDSVTSALSRFPHTVGQCVGLCAYISHDLNKLDIKNEVVLGSLICAGVDLFNTPILLEQNQSYELKNWPSHAWIRFSGDIIGEPSLLRTVKHSPKDNELYRHFEQHRIIAKEALLMNQDEQRKFELEYVTKEVLKENQFDKFINGLIFLNKDESGKARYQQSLISSGFLP